MVFKHKPAYEMRISDWSSDVCSSDLAARAARTSSPARRGADRNRRGQDRAARSSVETDEPRGAQQAVVSDARAARGDRRRHRCRLRARPGADQLCDRGEARTRERRSEEHTSELQSLMRISYAVFCLKKKKQDKNSRY